MQNFGVKKQKNKPDAVECHWTDFELIMKYYIHPAKNALLDSGILTSQGWNLLLKTSYKGVVDEFRIHRFEH